MKRVGHLWEQVVAAENLRRAFHQASKGKADRREVIRFRETWESSLEDVRQRLLQGRFLFGRHHHFTIRDPKERIITVAPFDERLVHHALMNVCGPYLERRLIDDTFACRLGKGRLAAIHRAAEFARGHRWVLKADIRRYFASVDHAGALRQLGRHFKDPWVLQHFARILATSPGASQGLPIGSLVSQHLANMYLGPMDRWVKEEQKVRGYVRYMDDFLILGDRRDDLLALRGLLSSFLIRELGLELNPSTRERRLSDGVDFLGYRLTRETSGPVRVGLTKRSRRRFRDQMYRMAAACESGWMTDAAFQRRSQAVVEFTRGAKAQVFRSRILRQMNFAAIGHTLRDPRRQLEQPGEELPVLQAQQERAGQEE